MGEVEQVPPPGASEEQPMPGTPPAKVSPEIVAPESVVTMPKEQQAWADTSAENKGNGSGNASSFSARLKREMEQFPNIPRITVSVAEATVKAIVPPPESEPTNVLTALPRAVSQAMSKEKLEKFILKGLNMDLEPGSCTLVIGPPGCGKSSLLKLLAGRYHSGVSRSEILEGKVFFNGREVQEFCPLCREGRHDRPKGGNDAGFLVQRIAGLVGQHDTLIGEFTVGETLDFSRDISNADAAPASFASTIADKTSNVMSDVGLSHVQHTLVGNEAVRGVSRGEKRRVSIAQGLVGPYRVMCLDEITNGLDTSRATAICRSLQEWAKTTGGVVVACLQQPPPDVVQCFDEIVLLSEGQQMFQGTVDEAVSFFGSVGYPVPQQVDLADFMLDMTSEFKSLYAREGVSLSNEAIIAEFRKSEPFVRTSKRLQEHQTPSKPAVQDDALVDKQYKKVFARSWFQQLWIIAAFQFKYQLRDKEVLQARFGQAVMMGLMSGSLFWDMEDGNFPIRYGFLYFAMLLMSFTAFAMLPQVFAMRSVFYKERDASLYSTTAFTVGSLIVQLPFHLLESIIYSAEVYFMVGLSDDDGGVHFWVFFLILLGLNISYSAVLRCIATMVPSLDLSQPACGFISLFFMLTAGFTTFKDDIPAGYKWLYHINIFQYGISALAVNEFRSDKFSAVVPGTGKTLGETFLEAYQFPTDKEVIGYTFAADVVYYVIAIVVMSIGLHFQRHTSVAGAVNTSGGSVQSSDKKADKKKAAMPFVESTLTFKDISYWVTVKKQVEHGDSPGDIEMGSTSGGSSEKKRLLNSVSGYAKPGTMTALMGASGAGKTTLLDVVAGRKLLGSGTEMSGEILVNGEKLPHSKFASVSGYVEQGITLPSKATVNEALLMSAAMRLPTSVDESTRVEFVKEVMDVLGIADIANEQIGDVSEGAAGLSLEAGKRVSIGMELVANPAILFLDEPTTGLDSRGAMVVMEAISNIAATGRSVVCTIHQPSSSLFSMFDRLLLLQKGGDCVYLGPIGVGGAGLLEYFGSIPGVHQIPPRQNPATYILDVLDGGAANFYTSYEGSKLRGVEMDALAQLSAAKPSQGASSNGETVEIVVHDANQGCSTLRRVQQHLLYLTRTYWRSPEYNFVRMIVAVMIGLVFGSIYWRGSRDTSTTSGLFSTVSAVYMSMLFLMIISAFSALPTVFRERDLFYKQNAAGMYGPAIWIFSFEVSEIPYNFVFSILFAVVFYPLVGLQGSNEQIFLFFGTIILAIWMAVSVALFVGTVSKNPAVAQVVMPGMVTVWVLFGGFMIARKDIPDGWIWLHYLSPLTYLSEAVIMDQVRCVGNSDMCTNLINLIGPNGIPVGVSPERYMEIQFRWSASNIQRDLGIVAAFCCWFTILGYLLVRFKKHIKN